MGIKIVLKIESFAFFDSSRFMTTEWCKARITAQALPIWVSSYLSCLPPLVNATPRSLPASVLLHSLVTRTDQGLSEDEVLNGS